MAEDYTDYITQGAIARGLDPKAALRTVDTEGGRSGKVGDSGTSFGPFQMHVGGTAPGTTAKGLGDAMLAQGLDPRDPHQSIDFALDYAKAHGGFSPDIWHGLRSGSGLAPGEHRWVGAPSGGGGQPLYLGTLEKNFHDTGNSLLDALLAQNYPKEDKPTGNGLLDQIMQQAVFGIGPPNQAQPAPDAAKALGRVPQALPPQTVPELSGQQVDIKPMQSLQPAAIAPPEPGKEMVPSVQQPTTPTEATPPAPIPQPGAAQPSFDTGNGLLDRILKQLSPIASAQAAEPPAAPQPVPATHAVPTPVQPAPAPSQPPPPQQFIEPPAKGQQVPPAVQPRAALATPQTPAQAAAPLPRVPPAPLTLPSEMLAGQPESGVAKFGEATAESIGQLLDMFLKQPLEAGARGISGQDEPGTPQAIEDAMAGAQLASASSIGRGGMGAGPRLPERIEPPPMRFTEAAREAPSEPLAPKQPEISPPATPPGAPAEAREPPPPSDAAQPPIKPPPPGETPPPAPLTPPPDGNGPVITPPTLPDGNVLKVTRQRVQDDLNWIVRSQYADSIEGKQFWDGLPKEFQDPGFRARVGRDIERRLVEPNVELNPETQRFLDLPEVKRWTSMEHRFGTILSKLKNTELERLGLEPQLRTVEQGHVHRMVEGRRPPGEIVPTSDPIMQRQRGLGGRSLSTSASGVKARSDHYVGQDDAGNRVFSQKRLSQNKPTVPRGYTRFYSDGEGGWTPDRDVIRERHPNGIETHYVDFPTTQAGQFRQRDGTYNLPNNAERSAKIALPERYGDRYRVGQTPYTAREPTMTEREDNTLPGELPVKYRNDYLLGLINNVNRMRTVVRRINTLHSMKADLERMGYWVPRAGEHDMAPTATDGSGKVYQYVPVSQHVPVIGGGWAHPRIANTINDFARRYEDPNILEKIQNLLVGSMFVLPVGHIRNVGAHYVIGRGLDWGYRNPHLAQAATEVWNLGPVYQKFIRNNGPAMYPGAADIHGKLVDKLLNDMARDPGWEITAKSLGTTMKKLLPALYKASNRSLWMTNDILFLARTLENLKRYGHADPMTAPDVAWTQAINHTKREIPAYEMSDQVLGSRAIQQALVGPNSPVVFGRYTRDKYAILGENVKEMIGRYGKGLPQLEGATKALLTLMLAFPVTSILTAALIRATGNPNAKVYGAGPTTVTRSTGGGAGKLAGVDQKGWPGWMLGMTPAEADWSHALAGILSVNPAIESFFKVFGGGHDPYTGQPIVGQHASPLGITSQLLEGAIGSFYPGEIALQALRQGPGALTEPLGFNLAGPKPPSGKSIRMQRGFEHGREKRDPFQQKIVRPAARALGLSQ